MKILSLDIETTGIDQENDMVLSLGAVLEDTKNIKPISELPKFHVYVDYDRLAGNIYAFSMNKHNIDKIIELKKKKVNDEKLTTVELLKKYQNIEPVDILVSNTENLKGAFMYWLLNHVEKEPVVIAGKQVARFDLPFLESKVFGKDFFYTSSIFSKRTIDPSILYADWNDTVLPSTELCNVKAGFEPDIQHDALGDAINIIKLLRHATNNYGWQKTIQAS